MARKPRTAPWIPVEYTASIVTALQALSRGEANEGQQKMALRWIIEDCASTYDEPYRSDADGGDRDTAYACGRRFVGLQIVKLVTLPGAVIDNLRKKNG